MQRTAISLNILFSILLLLLIARGLADIAAYKLGTAAPRTKNQSLTATKTVSSPTLQSAGIILEKGLFGLSTKGALIALTTTVSAPTPQTTAQSDLVLLGTAVASTNSTFALIRKTSSNEERVFRLGERVFDLGLLHAVRKESIDLKNNSTMVTLHTPTTPQGSGKQSAASLSNQSTGVIQANSGGSGVIDQRALNAALDNIGQAMTDARMLPSVKDGKVEGFRVSEVKPQGVFAAVGLKNGDVLAKINDFPVDSPEKAIQSFMTLKGQNRIKLDLIRDGAPTTMTYDIR